MTTQTHKWLPEKPTISMLNNTSFKNLPIWVREQIYKEMYQAAPAVEQEPVEMTDEILESIEESARESYRRYKTSVRGQTISRLDDYNYHIILATIKQSEQVELKRELLSEDEIFDIAEMFLSVDESGGRYEVIFDYDLVSFTRAIEKAHGIGG
jgi:hypothetical protein